MDVDDRPEGAVGGENYQNADFPGRESGGKIGRASCRERV